ncbi:hypothetical protein A0J61_06739 [Choanephora cucurbitarum]|uniref:Uncharacterized protein n=1 Tax=Choanephora cucurbitarum TaxID=101091 RepID=A0A1C7N8E3_9FUNG|nr:hypothetical protein A0J61_06739 [Choanephora cucurbitarum]
MKAFKGFTLKKSTANSFILHEGDNVNLKLGLILLVFNQDTNGVMKYAAFFFFSIDESGFNINRRPFLMDDQFLVASTPSAKVESHSILSAIATVGVVDLSFFF